MEAGGAEGVDYGWPQEGAVEIVGLRHGGMRSGIFLIEGPSYRTIIVVKCVCESNCDCRKGSLVELVFGKVKWKCPSWR